MAFAERAEGERADNIERAIAYYNAALTLTPRERYPREWADLQNNLGNAYHARLRGDPAENFEISIAMHQAALSA